VACPNDPGRFLEKKVAVAMTLAGDFGTATVSKKLSHSIGVMGRDMFSAKPFKTWR
jgi:hypothetical protein